MIDLMSRESWSDSKMLSLTEALDTDRLEEFIKQEQARGVGPISEAEFDDTASTVIKTPPRSYQTSGSPRRGGSPEK
jgi:hypothetical protein